MGSWAIYSKDKSFLFDIQATTEEEALLLAKSTDPDATYAVTVCPGNDHGVFQVE